MRGHPLVSTVTWRILLRTVNGGTACIARGRVRFREQGLLFFTMRAAAIPPLATPPPVKECVAGRWAGRGDGPSLARPALLASVHCIQTCRAGVHGAGFTHRCTRHTAAEAWWSSRGAARGARGTGRVGIELGAALHDNNFVTTGRNTGSGLTGAALFPFIPIDAPLLADVAERILQQPLPGLALDLVTSVNVLCEEDTRTQHQLDVQLAYLLVRGEVLLLPCDAAPDDAADLLYRHDALQQWRLRLK